MADTTDSPGFKIENFFNRISANFLAAVVISSAFVLSTFIISYITWSTNGLPIGWDTPHYAGGAILAASQGLQGLLAVQGPYDFLYQAFEGMLVWIGLPALTLEIYFPLALTLTLPCLLGRLGQVHSGTRFGMLVAAATPAWYAIYRLPADLHANLLAIILLLTVLLLFSKKTGHLNNSTLLATFILVGLASFTHIETTLFFAGILFFSALATPELLKLKTAIFVLVATIPATLFYLLHLLQLSALSGGSISFSSTFTLDSLLVTLLPLLPVVLAGLVWATIRPRSGLERFASIWGVFSLGIGFSQYVFPQTAEFAFRAILLFPVPILAAVAIREISSGVGGLGAVIRNWPMMRIARGTSIILLAILVVSWPIAYGNAAQYHRVYISDSQYTDLEWVHNNLKFSSTPIFVLNDLDSYAGELGRLYDYWISATIGPHLSYLGLVDYLAQLEETPFNNSLSSATSGIFMQQIRSSGIGSLSALSQHPVVVIGGLYRPFPLPTYTAYLFQEAGPDVFVANNTRLELLSNTTIPLYATFLSHSGTWHASQEVWAQSENAYEVNDTLTSKIYASFFVGVPAAATYTVSLRFLDYRGNGLAISVDGVTIGQISYTSSYAPRVQSMRGIMITSGSHLLTIAIDNSPGSVRFAALDFLSVTST